MGRRTLVALAAVAVLAAGAPACGGGHECVDVDLACDPLYPPTFDNVFTTTLLPKCGAEGNACHSIEGHRNGLVFADIDDAYDELLGLTEDGARLVPSDASCSEMIMRISATDPDYLMPPGQPLSPEERCALTLWVANGAER